MEDEKGEATHNSELMLVPEGADFLRLKISTVRAWILRRKIPYIKLGGKVLFRRSDLQALIDKSIINPL